MINQELLLEIMEYNGDTGLFKWKKCNRTGFSGKPAGSARADGYIRMKICGSDYLAHRLAWLYVHGEFPDGEIDHINRNPSDNRIANLRVATRSENQRNTGMQLNNKSGFRGVFWNKQHSKWMAQAVVGKKNIYLGFFESPEKASDAYQTFAKNAFGDFHPDRFSELTEPEKAAA